MGAQVTTFAPCPEPLRLIECGEFCRTRQWIFGEGRVAQKIAANVGEIRDQIEL